MRGASNGDVAEVRWVKTPTEEDCLHWSIVRGKSEVWLRWLLLVSILEKSVDLLLLCTRIAGNNRLLMSLLLWFDNRTLFGCQCMLAVMFTVVFLWMRSAYPSIRGARSIVLSYLVGVPCTLFMVSRGHIPTFISVTVGNLLALLSVLFLYDGFVRFVGGRSRWWLLGGIAAVSLGVVFFYSEIRSSIVPRILAMTLSFAVFRWMLAWELLRKSTVSVGSPNRGTMRFFGGFLVFLGLFNLYRGGMTFWFGAPENLLERDAVQTVTMALNVLYIGVSGLCFVIMASHELITRSMEDSERDLLSGTLNRRGIEMRLSVELGRSDRSRQRLSVALVDIDHFKTINDSHGHAAGDAAIRAVAAAMTRRLRTSDALGRYGGDEFLVVLPMTGMSDAAVVAERLNEAVTSLELIAGSRGLTLSIGITEASPEDDAIVLIARADEALYQAKSAGRNCMRAVTPARTFPELAPGELETERLGWRAVE